MGYVASGKNEGYLGMKMEPKGSGPCMYLNSEKISRNIYLYSLKQKTRLTDINMRVSANLLSGQLYYIGHFRQSDQFV
jgi:hypothetical protein